VRVWALLFLPLLSVAAERPIIQKLGTIDVDLVETTPIVLHGRLYRFEYVRKGYWANQSGDDYFHFIDHATGKATPPFAKGLVLGSALVAGDTVYVTGTGGKGRKWGSEQIHIFASRDLK
jgi:hypothetical protein